jgi:AhpD family alkylhydroperoxidase
MTDIDETMFIDPVAIDELPPSLAPLAEPRPGASDEAAARQGAWIGLFAHSPEQAERMFEFYFRIWHENQLGPRLTELVRLAIANTTQCEMCLQARVPAAIEDGLTDDEIAYITELEASGFSARERAAIRFALNLGGDHHSIDAGQWDELAAVFETAEIVELCMMCATFLGFGRVAKAVGMVHPSCTVPGRRLVSHPDATAA